MGLRKHLPRTPTTALLVGVLLVVVGVGNAVVGSIKSASSTETVVRLELHLKNSPNVTPTDTAIYKKALARREYYQIVRAGGMAILFAGIGLVLLELLRPPRPPRPPAADSTPTQD